MTREQAIAKLKNFADHCYPNEEFLIAIQALQAQADGDYISRQDAIEFFKDDVYVVNELKNMATVAIPSAEPYDFAKWVASEIFDDMWEYNKDAFAEIACRKLEKMGIVRAKGDEWELVEEQKSEG